MTILSIRNNKVALTQQTKQQTSGITSQNRPMRRSGDMMNTLGIMGRINLSNVTFASKHPKTYAGQKLALSAAELDRRLDKDHTITIKLLAADAPEFTRLAEGDKQALSHLVKVAEILNDVALAMDNEKNLACKQALEEASSKGDRHAQKALKLFNSMNGVSGIDRNSEMTDIFEGTTEEQGKNFYPPKTTEAELKTVVAQKLDEGKTDEVKALLSQRTIVRHDEQGGLKAIDYVDAFPKEFNAAADELEKAAKVSTNADFNAYLQAQAKAFRKADPELDCEADRLWAKMQDTPLEFTITREPLDDNLTGTVLDDETLKQRLESHGVNAYAKDSIGIRVGIVNQGGTIQLFDYKKYLPELADQMPLKEHYTQSISSTGDAKQTMVDVDLVCMRGQAGACRGGIFIAENLPNDDKLAVKRNYGRRNVYHRQIRQNGATPEAIKKLLDAILDPELHQYYDDKADHKFVIGHENAHSLGPRDGKEKIGKWHDTIEEGKADMGAMASLDHLVARGKYTEQEKKQIIVAFATNSILKAKPELKQAHRVRTVMQLNYFIKHGAMHINEQGVLHVNFEKMVPTAKLMLKDFVAIQMSKDPKKAKAFVKKYFKWTHAIAKAAKNLQRVNKKLHGVLEAPLADQLLRATHR